MDPYLQAILQSGNPAKLLEENRPDWAVPLGQGRAEVSSGELPGPPLPPRLQEMRDMGKKAYDYTKDPLSRKDPFIKQVIAALVSLNDPRAKDELPSAQSVAMDWWNPAMGMVGILTNKANSPELVRSLQKAMEAETKGWPSQKIWDKFGWEKNVAGQWVRRIPDDSLRLTSKAQEIVGGQAPAAEIPLSQVVNWPELFATHPEAASILTKVVRGEFGGSYLPRIAAGGSKMKLQGQSPAEVLEAFQHEGSHAVSDLAGLPAGSNPRASTLQDIQKVKSTPTSVKDLEDLAFAAYWRQAGEVTARNEAANFVNPELRKFAPSTHEDVPRMLQIIRFLQEMSPQKAIIDINAARNLELARKSAKPGRYIQHPETKTYLTFEEAVKVARSRDPGFPREGELVNSESLANIFKHTEARLVDSDLSPQLAVKAKGGMWHPEAVERLAVPLQQSLVGRGENVNPALRDFLADGEINWANRAIRNYLNKHAGTKEDPLRDVEIPFKQGTKRWEEITDASFKSVEGRRLRRYEVMQNSDFDTYSVYDAMDRQVSPKFRTLGEAQDWAREKQPGLREEFAKVGRDEKVWGTGLGHETSVEALTSYLSHVGDYLRQNVPPEKLQQYDLVRAVKETVANDARVAKEMEKAAQASMKDLPVYKEYPTGFKWVELKLSEKLTEEQAKGVRAATKEEAPGIMRHETSYLAVDSKGKVIQNSYTGGRVGGRTPEEAHLAGQLAQEGNQMGHCVGGYCEEVASGESRIFSLRDAKGRSHVTVEVGKRMPDEAFHQRMLELAGPRRDELLRKYDSTGRGDSDVGEFLRDHYPDIAVQLEKEQLVKPSDIIQIKGKQNRAPSAEYLPYVQDFVKSGKWGEVGDLRNTGLYQLKTRPGKYHTHEELMREAKEALKKGNYADESAYRNDPAGALRFLENLDRNGGYIDPKELR